MKICVNCGSIEEDDTKTNCRVKGRHKNTPGLPCGGPLRPVNCLKCLESGKVQITDPRKKEEPETIPCPAGCGRKREEEHGED